MPWTSAIVAPKTDSRFVNTPVPQILSLSVSQSVGEWVSESVMQTNKTAFIVIRNVKTLQRMFSKKVSTGGRSQNWHISQLYGMCEDN